ncbi:YdcF family protein [Blastococcus sp. URHD0036]|uniref:YdcF family protein n=1 Tax=Blastococcus sp. URHD0036 TaxID=1380356 RepID=UPI00068F53A5|nr:ElyC/SanA/YdcF family protein [Blastococcus sp. URHD0036]
MGVGLLALLVAVSVRLFVFPGDDPPERSDAVILLAGDPETRIPLALDLAREGPGVLVVSTPPGEVNDPARALCDEPQEGLEIRCFTPPEDPPGTRGEARVIGELVERYDWTAVTVVTSSYHVQRAGVLIRRCTDADVTVVAGRPTMSVLRWSGAILHEFGGLAAAVVEGDC